MQISRVDAKSFREQTATGWRFAARGYRSAAISGCLTTENFRMSVLSNIGFKQSVMCRRPCLTQMVAQRHYKIAAQMAVETTERVGASGPMPAPMSYVSAATKNNELSPGPAWRHCMT